MRIRHGTVEIDIGPRSARLITALLLVRPGQSVTLPEIADLLWGPDAPRNATQVVCRQLAALRQALGLDGTSEFAPLPADEETLDLLGFRRLAEHARSAVCNGNSADAVPLYVQALDLWRGRCAADLEPAAALHPAFIAVNREGSIAAREAADVALATGQAHAVLDSLRKAVDRDPLDPALRVRLVRLLAADHRAAEATVALQDACRAWIDTIGTQPDPELDDARCDIDATTFSRSATTQPAQLPSTTRMFAGRHAELRSLSRWTPPDASVAIVAIDGMPGVGKSTLAVHWAHQAAPLFPDGQLFVNLRGFDARGTIVEPDEALTGFLSALGVNHREIPPGTDAKAALYRTMTAGRRMLVLLDNARDADQVRPLIPGSGRSMVIVTSRSRLTTLAVSQGAHLLVLDVPSPTDARESLRLRLGADVTTDDLDAIASGCGRLPLAMAILAARTHSAAPMSSILDQLKTSRKSLDTFSCDDPTWNLRSVCHWSYQLLSTEAARLFRLLSVHPGPDFSLPSMASLAGHSPHDTELLVAELTRTRLLTEHHHARYVFHDLIHAYAIELAEATDSHVDLDAATFRIADHLRQTAYAANVILMPPMPLTPPPAPAPGVTPETIRGSHSAIAWFDTEFAVLEAVITTVSHEDFQPWTIVNMILPYAQSVGRYEAFGNLSRFGLTAAVTAGDQLGQAHMYRMIAGAALLQGSEPPLDHLHRAETLFQQLGYDLELGFTLRNLGLGHWQLGQPERSIEYYQRASALFTKVGHRLGEAVTWIGLSESLAKLGRHDEALAQIEPAVSRLQAMGDKASWGSALTVRARILADLGRLAESIPHYQHAIQLSTDVLYRVAQAEYSYELSGVHLRLGQPEAAELLLRSTLPVAEQAGLHALARQIRDRLDQLSQEDTERSPRDGTT